MPDVEPLIPSKQQRRRVRLGLRLLRYAAGAVTAIAIVGGAGWLSRQRAKRGASNRADFPDDTEDQ